MQMLLGEKMPKSYITTCNRPVKTECFYLCPDPECIPGAGLTVSHFGVHGEKRGHYSQRYHLQRPSEPADGRAGGVLSVLSTAGHR